nr:hypothetical protein GCM10020093_110600 [Planobispora longispora]
MENPVEDYPRKSWRRTALGVLLGCLVAAVVLLFVLGRDGEPTDASAEAGFARDMAVHHSQAVQMSFITRDGSADDKLRVLTYDIIITQTAQRGMFMGWLQQWELNQAGGQPPMAWMAGHGHGGGTPPPAPGRRPRCPAWRARTSSNGSVRPPGRTRRSSSSSS